jgi:hypothetical protein
LKKLTQSRWFEIIFITLISGFAYLPRIGEFMYYRDDWYFLYGALVIGPKALVEVALHTRPIRGPLYELYYSLFGLNPFPYHIVMYLTRLAGGIGALWLFNLIWPKNRRGNFFMATLFLLFPGFLWWVAGFEFQPYVLSVTLQVFSIAFTLKAVASDFISRRIGWTMAALLSGWAYLALVEYAIGMEAFRLICVYLYVRQKHDGSKFIPTAFKTMQTSAFHLLIPGAFLFWYTFLFDNWRKAQDAGTQFSILFSSPITLIWRLVDIFRGVLNVSITAWVVPFYNNFFGNRLRDILLGLLCAALSVVAIYLMDWLSRKDKPDEQGQSDAVPDSLQKELLWVGLLGTLGGILPVILANRVITFERISQYTLPASLTGAVVVGGLLYSVFSRNFRLAAFSALVGMAVLSHQGLAAQTVVEEKTIADFWWQVSWRAPDIKSGTTLAVIYPDLNYLEGNDVVWGPANFIYYPDEQTKMPVTVPVAASRMETDSMLDIINGNRDFEQTDLVIKNTITYYNYKNLLVMSRPRESSCVHVIDQRWPDISINDQPLIHAAFQNSRIENIVPNPVASVPPAYAFGQEPPHDWCYYYQKADLARQQGDWQLVANLGNEAQKLGLHPNDQVEWMPFLQAYAFLGDQKHVKEISTRIKTESFYRQQACRNLNAMADYGYPLSPEMQSSVERLYCD